MSVHRQSDLVRAPVIVKLRSISHLTDFGRIVDRKVVDMMEELGVNRMEDVHPAMINYEVLEKILSFLNPNDVKESRLVCKLWATVGKKELGNQTFLVINKLDFENLEDGGIPSVHPHFVRRIKIHLKRGLTVYSPMPVDHFLPFLAIHRSKIEELLFQGQGYFRHPVQTVLEAVKFPNLIKISLHELDQEKCGGSVHEEFQMPIALRTVKKLEFWPSEWASLEFTNGRNFPLFQEIINKCPNLEELKVFRQFYPDLSSCVNLKSLEWVGPRSVTNGRTQVVYFGKDLKTAEIIGMLTPIKDRLENLFLGSPMDEEADSRFIPQGGYPHWDYPEPYPSMPKLTKLFVSDVNLFGISYDSFNQDRLPALKNFTLRSMQKYEFPIRKFLSDSKYVKNDEVKLESLSLNQVPLEDVGVWEQISSTFPNLKELSSGFTAEHGIRGLTAEIASNPGKLQTTLTTLSRNIVNLEKLTIDIKFVCTFFGLVDAIYVNDFQGNDFDSKKLRLKLVAPDPDLITDDERTLDGPPKISESLLIYKSLTFQGFRIRDQTRKKMQDFVVERDLKDVYFLQ